MSLGISRSATLVSLISLVIMSACSGSSSSGPAPVVGTGTILSASQDLGLDPSGQTTQVTLSAVPAVGLTLAHFAASGGQNAVAVGLAGSVASVQWDARVTPGHSVNLVGLSGFDTNPQAVSTTDPVAPTFSIAAGNQSAGLGGDSFSIQFSGANVVESSAEDLSNWDLVVAGSSLDLSGSSFVFNAASQSLAVTLGSAANLHSTFGMSPSGVLSVADVSLVSAEIPGTASGDASLPSLVSAEQNLVVANGGDASGLVVDFTFDEAMDLVFNGLSDFQAGFPTLPQSLTRPTPEVLRVTFNNPVVPGLDTITLLSLIDIHGNQAVGGAIPITAGSTLPNDFSALPVVNTVEGSGGDSIQSSFLQGFDPDAAVLPASWVLESPIGNAIDLSAAAFAYDLNTKQLSITLSNDDLSTGDSFRFRASGTPAVDIDGELFAGDMSGTVGGDSTPNTVASVTQNRALQSSGDTFDVLLSEEVTAASANVLGNYVISGGGTPSSALLQPGGQLVRLVVSGQTIPGQATLAVSGLVDLAGNAMLPAMGLAIGSTDQSAPGASSVLAEALEGLDNDTITVVFDDDLISAEILTKTNWLVETPAGIFHDLTLASLSWNAAARSASLVFGAGTSVELMRGDYFAVSFSNLRDVAGNVVDGATSSGAVIGESMEPSLVSVSVLAADSSKLHVRMSEPCLLFDDALTHFVMRNAGGVIKGGQPSVVTDADRMGAVLTFSAGATAGNSTLDVRGIIDVVGNQMFPVQLAPIVDEISAEPSLEVGMQSYLSVSGASNDTLTILFDQPMSPFQLLRASNYALSNGMDSADFSFASMEFDGDRTVSVTFDGLGALDLDNGLYTLTINGVCSAQGVQLMGTSVESASAAVGSDLTPAALVAGRTRLDAGMANAVLLELDEAIDAAVPMSLTNVDIGGTNPTALEILGARTLRATFAVQPTIGQMINVSASDLAGNAGVLSTAILAEETTGPSIVSVQGISVPGQGADRFEVVFDQALGNSYAVPLNYTLSSQSVAFDISQSSISLDSASNTVSIPLAPGVDLGPADILDATISGLSNHDGFLITPASSMAGSVTGDTTGPSFSAAFANYREHLGGLEIDVRFDEDVQEAYLLNLANYVFSGGQVAQGVNILLPDTVRLSIDQPLLALETLTLVDLPDSAGNLSGTIVVEPAL